MRNALILGLFALLCASLTHAEDLNGKQIKVNPGDGRGHAMPITIAWDGAAPEGKIEVLGPEGSVHPATLRDGELVFVAAPENITTYTVSVKDAGDARPRVELRKESNADSVGVYIDGEHFTTYNYSNDKKKPYLYPVLSEDGVPVTRAFPMSTEGVPKYAQDHPHHKSWWTAYGNVNGADLWGEGFGSGFQHSGEVTWGSGDAYGWIIAKNVWQNGNKKPVIDETREYRFYATSAEGRLTDVRVTFTAKYGDARFGDTKEGGIVSVRMRPELSYANADITNNHGDKGERECWGKPAAWCDYAGELDEHGYRGLTIMDHPENLRHPTSWHVRRYGLMGANCFGYSYFSEKDYNKPLVPDNGDYTVPEGETLVFNYRVFVHSGDVEEAKVGKRYAAYESPADARWE